MRIAICDDEPHILAFLHEAVQSGVNALKMNGSIQLFQDAAALLPAHAANAFDLIFLDICMPGTDGFAAARTLRQQAAQCFLVFVTSKDELVYDCFDYQPFQFIRKGNLERLAAEIQLVLQKLLHYLNTHAVLTLEVQAGKQVQIPYQNILYVKSDNHYAEYHLDAGQPVTIRQDLGAAEAMLSPHGFVRIHRRYLVNLHAVRQIDLTARTVTLHTRGCLPLGRKYKDAALQQYREYMRALP